MSEFGQNNAPRARKSAGKSGSQQNPQTTPKKLSGAKTSGQRVSTEQPKILYEDNHLIAVDKPAGWQTQSSARSEPNVLDWVRGYLKAKYHKPGNVYVGMVHRLDLPVRGVLLFARTSKAASRLSESIRTRSVEKEYLAVVEGCFAGGGIWEAFLSPEANPCVQVSDQPRPGWALAQMEVSQPSEELLDKIPRRRVSTNAGEPSEFSLVWIRLLTGRKHQIRAMLAQRGWPIVGDSRYGAKKKWDAVTTDAKKGVAKKGDGAIALLSYRLQFEHPVTRNTVEIFADCTAWGKQWLI